MNSSQRRWQVDNSLSAAHGRWLVHDTAWSYPAPPHRQLQPTAAGRPSNSRL